jgi:hypothetical protein
MAASRRICWFLCDRVAATIAARAARRVMKTSGEGAGGAPEYRCRFRYTNQQRPSRRRVRLGAARVSRLPRNSLVRYSPAVVLLAILIADSNRHTDPDLWGHTRFGQAFVANRHLIDRDPYSYFAAGARHDY